MKIIGFLVIVGIGPQSWAVEKVGSAELKNSVFNLLYGQADNDLTQTKNSAMQGNLDDQVKLGLFYFFGIGVPVDFQMAEIWFEEPLVNKHPLASFWYTMIHAYHVKESKLTLKQSVELLNIAADGGIHLARSFLGVLYFDGVGVEKNQDYAIALWREASMSNCPLGQHLLGLMYRDGHIVTKDHAQYYKLQKQSAISGFRDAQHELAVCFAYGRGVKKDFTEALQWYKKAAYNGNNLSQFNLGNAYQKGVIVKKDLDESYKWFSMAYENGIKNAKAAMALVMMSQIEETGTSKYGSRKDGIRLLQEAANEGSDLAAFIYGAGLANNQWGENNPKEIFHWYYRAAWLGNEHAPSLLADCYETGFGTEKSDIEAYKWNLLSFQYGNKSASIKMAAIELFLSIEEKNKAKRWLEAFKPVQFEGQSDEKVEIFWQSPIFNN